MVSEPGKGNFFTPGKIEFFTKTASPPCFRPNLSNQKVEVYQCHQMYDVFQLSQIFQTALLAQ